MRKIAWLMTLVMALVAVPAFAGGDKCTAADAQACLDHWAAKKDMGWVGLDYDKSNASAVKVKAVTAGSPAARAGFQPGDVLLTLNGASFTDKEALKKAKGEWKIGQTVNYTVRRNNTETKLTATLEKMPEEVFATMIGQHMLSSHLAVASTTGEAPVQPTAAQKANK